MPVVKTCGQGLSSIKTTLLLKMAKGFHELDLIDDLAAADGIFDLAFHRFSDER